MRLISPRKSTGDGYTAPAAVQEHFAFLDVGGRGCKGPLCPTKKDVKLSGIIKEINDLQEFSSRP
jgi:hypothetical protein